MDPVTINVMEFVCPGCGTTYNVENRNAVERLDRLMRKEKGRCIECREEIPDLVKAAEELEKAKTAKGNNERADRLLSKIEAGDRDLDAFLEFLRRLPKKNNS